MKIKEFIENLKDTASAGGYSDWENCEIGFINKEQKQAFEFLDIVAEGDNYIDVVLNIE